MGAIAAGSFVATTSADEAKEPKSPVVQGTDPANNIKLPPGIKLHENDDVSDVRSSLLAIVTRTLTPAKLDSAVAYLANQDRDRIKADLPKKNPELDGRVEQIRGLYKLKFGEELELKVNLLDSVTEVRQGEVEDAAIARQHWPVPAVKDGDEKPIASKVANNDPKIENGREVAIVQLTGPADTPALTLSLQYELPDYWVLDVPNGVTSAAMLKGQAESLQRLIDRSKDWPKSKDEAGQFIAAYVLQGYFSEAPPQPMAGVGGKN
jgi:hypothetical protein